jgi:decaprenyl-phosphate phosphoribosyltransferase
VAEQVVADPLAKPVPTLRGHLAICRIDHWFKNVFVLPGVVVAIGMEPDRLTWDLLPRLLVGLFAIGLVASSNYIVNELLDAPFDRHHPTKSKRPVPSGRVHIGLAYVQWIVVGAAGLALARTVSNDFALSLLALWLAGCAYNLRPLRTKDRPYLDVLSESLNNPLRMLAGWFIVGPNAFPPGSLLLSYWMIGGYFMAMKRLAEFRQIGPECAAAYRRSFAWYDESRLFVSVMFYASSAMLFLGAFIVRYRLSLIFSTPLVALVMALYLRMGLRENSPVQTPEHLYREPLFVAAVTLCAVVMSACMFVDAAFIADWFAPTAPIEPIARP